MTVGEKIRYFRKRLGITQNELAKRADLHPVSIRKYETNKMTPQIPAAKKLATALGVTLQILLEGVEDETRLKPIGIDTEKPNCKACLHYQACMMWAAKELGEGVVWCQIWAKETLVKHTE